MSSTGSDSYGAHCRSRRFAPGPTGLASPLGALEEAVMEAVWACPRPVSVAEVLSGQPAGPRAAYTTIKTTMDRLVRKGILLRSKRGRAYVYWAGLSQLDLERRIVATVLDQLLRSFPDAAAAMGGFGPDLPGDRR